MSIKEWIILGIAIIAVYALITLIGKFIYASLRYLLDRKLFSKLGIIDKPWFVTPKYSFKDEVVDTQSSTVHESASGGVIEKTTYTTTTLRSPVWPDLDNYIQNISVARGDKYAKRLRQRIFSYHDLSTTSTTETSTTDGNFISQN